MLRLKAEEATCSFCGAAWSPDNRFAGGMGAMMCARCLKRYGEIFDSPEAMAEMGEGRWWDDMSTDDMVDMLPKIVATERQVNLFLRDWVALLRERGLSWTDIGSALGVTRQAVWERFSKDR